MGGGADHARPQRRQPVVDDRRAPLRLPGALAARAGLLAVPLLLVLLLAVAYAQWGSHPNIAGALRGMGAVAAGLIIATGIKLRRRRSKPIRRRPVGAALGAACFVAIALLRRPLAVLIGLGGSGWQLSPTAGPS